jgi:hypothetical protein
MPAHQHLQPKLFDMPEDPKPRMDYDPEAWASRPDVVHHSSAEHPMPQETGGGTGYGPGFHVGTFRSANDRRQVNNGNAPRAFVHPLRMSGQTALRPETHEFETESYPPQRKARPADPGSPEHPTTWNDWDANYVPGTNAVKAGLNVPYVNAHEDPGNVSFRSPRTNLSTWAEDVASDPGASRHHKLLAEQFDLTIPMREHDRANPDDPSTAPRMKKRPS